MEITGKITRVFEVVTGNGKKGMWSKQSFVIEQPGQYPKPVCVDLWGEDLITKYDLVVGLTVTAHINLESREYNGRWFTDVKAWKVTWDKQQKRECKDRKGKERHRCEQRADRERHDCKDGCRR